MKKSKIIIPALAMMVMSTAATVTGTVAWFSMNKFVTAEGITVNASADSSLVIRYGDSGDFSSKATASTTATTLKPTTSCDGVNFGRLGTGVLVESEDMSDATWSGAEGAFQSSDLVLIGDAEKAGYYAETRYNMKYLGGSSTSVYVKTISVTNLADNTLGPALRVSVQVGTGDAVLFNVGGGTNTNGVVGSYNTETTTWTLAAPSYASYNTNGAKIGEFNSSVQVVTVRTWFEGQDTICYSSKVDTENLLVSVQFESELNA